MVDKKDLRALRPQSALERFQAIRLALAGGLLIIVGTLLLLAQLATHDSPAFGIGAILFGIAIVVYSAVRSIGRRRRASAIRASAASVTGYQLNRTYSDVAAAQEAATAVALVPPERRRRGLTAVLVIVAIVALLIPAYRIVNRAPALGTVVPVGTAQTVRVTGDDYAHKHAAGTATVTVTGVRNATSADLSDLGLTRAERRQTAFLVDFRATRKSGIFDADDPGLFSAYNWAAVGADGARLAAVVTILPPSACPTGDGRDFASGAAVDGCEIILSDSTKPPRTVSFEESAGTFTWSTATG